MKLLLSVTMILCAAGLDVLVPKEKKMLTPGDTTLNWNLRLALSHTGLFMPLERQGETKEKKEFQCLSEMVDSD